LTGLIFCHLKIVIFTIKINVGMKCKYIVLPVCCWVLFFTSFTITPACAQPGSSDKGKSGTGDLICWWLFEPTSEGIQILQSFWQVHSLLKKNSQCVMEATGKAKSSFENRMHALKAKGITRSPVVTSVRRQIRNLSNEIAEIEEGLFLY
jgi:hypothetical protein